MLKPDTIKNLQVIFQLIDPLINKNIKAIGIGVPSVVDIENGIVYDVQNITSWKEVALKKLMEEEFQIPVLINNDANCFALGEKYFGKGQNLHSMIGLTIGTGLGAGIIINDKLYAGVNCGDGEFGNAIKMILYTYCPEMIILGGSISKSHSFFQKTIWERIHTYVYSNTLNRFHLEISELENPGVLGAAALYYDQQNFTHKNNH
jgi:glucokinase